MSSAAATVKAASAGQPSAQFETGMAAEPIEAESVLVPYLQVLWTNRRFLLKACACAIVASTVIAVVIPARYQSVTRLMPPESQAFSGSGLISATAGNSGAGLSGLAGLSTDLLGLKSSGALFVGILTSESVQDAVIDKFQLLKVYDDSKIEDARVDLAEHTDVSEDRKSGIIEIAVTDHNPKRAAGMAECYVTELDQLVGQVSTSSARRERIFLEQRLQSVKADLDSAAKNFSDFASKNTAIDIPAQGKAMVEAAAALQGELIAAQSELEGLKQVYTDGNVRVRSAEARVDELNKKLNEIGGAGGAGSKGVASDSIYPSIRQLPILGVTYADLYRQSKIEETVYELLTQQYELAKVQEAKEIPAVKVLDAARVPTKKIFPPQIAIVLLGALLGVFMGMVWVISKNHWDSLDPSDPGKSLATEVFTTVRTSVRWSRNGAGSNGHYPARSSAEPADGSGKAKRTPL